VLLVKTMHVVRGVVIPPRHSGARNIDMVLPDRTSPGLLEAFEAHKRGERPLPSLLAASHPEGSWGSKVIIGYVDGGALGTIPVIDGYLTHPATTLARMPTARDDGQKSVSDIIVSTAQAWLPLYDVPLPESISAEAVPEPTIPVDWQRKPTTRNAYAAGWATGWLSGAEAGYVEMVDGTPAGNGDSISGHGTAAPEMVATVQGATDGWKLGVEYGRAIGRGEPPEVPPAPRQEPDYAISETDGSAADVSDGDHVAATADGDSRMMEFAGVRVVVRSDGQTIIDSRDAKSDVRVQAAASSKVVVACGGMTFVVDSEAARLGTMTGGDALTLEPARKAAQDALISEINTAIFAAAGSNPSPVTSSPDCGATKARAV
jgi:hypothetical protein